MHVDVTMTVNDSGGIYVCCVCIAGKLPKEPSQLQLAAWNLKQEQQNKQEQQKREQRHTLDKKPGGRRSASMKFVQHSPLRLPLLGSRTGFS